jgi:hypothetical protein
MQRHLAVQMRELFMQNSELQAYTSAEYVETPAATRECLPTASEPKHLPSPD